MTISFKTAYYKVSEHMTKLHSRELNEFIRDSAQQLHRRLDTEFAEAADALRKITGEEQKHFNMLLAKWIASHFRPLILVEDEGFVEFIVFITETLCRIMVIIPKRPELRGCNISVAGDSRLHVRSCIEQSCVFFSFTSDI
ncbi:hypothetical protein JG688_00007771 [Phytophthora aleatoria]|uniref:Uncharacterized protein n=1 Tax=Phytophthora aleatoria TaxID=2496075 RepID=A0A8J5IK62_9STRA|nr:hypothetical protein JG688_00007771 [Phytophthora aleatoria]